MTVMDFRRDPDANGKEASSSSVSEIAGGLSVIPFEFRGKGQSVVISGLSSNLLDGYQDCSAAGLPQGAFADSATSGAAFPRNSFGTPLPDGFRNSMLLSRAPPK